MNDVSSLARAALEDALGLIVDRLFLDLNPLDCPAELHDQDVYNPGKEWDIDDLDFIAQVLRTAGLAPDRLGDEPSSPPANRLEPPPSAVASPPAGAPPPLLSRQPASRARRTRSKARE
jgi:hypothetical protein